METQELMILVVYSEYNCLKYQLQDAEIVIESS